MADSSAVAGLEPASQVWTDPATGAIVGVLTRQGVAQVTAVQASGLAGTTAPARLAGATIAGPPATGTFQAGDLVADQAGVLWACTVAGTPGTWVQAGAGTGLLPAGATGQTMADRRLASVGNQTVISGNLNVQAIYLPAGVPVKNITYVTGTTVEVSGAHGWYVLLDSGLVVRAVSADQVATAFWGTASTPVPLSVAAAGYVTTYTGLYYTGVMVAAGTPPSFVSSPSAAAGTPAIAPVLTGTSSTGQTVPPALGAQMTALTGTTTGNFFAFTT